MWTVPRVMVRRTVSPTHTDFDGLSSLAALVVVRLEVVPLPPRSLRRRWRVVSWADFSAGRDWWSGKRPAGGMSGDHDRCFSILVLGAFSTGVFNTSALPRINIGADVWGESSIMTGVYRRWCSSTLHIGWGLCACLCPVLVCRGFVTL